VTSKKVCLKGYPTFRILENGVATTTINSEDVDADPTIPGIYPNMASKKMRAALGAFYHKQMEKIDQSDATTAGEARSTTGLDEEEMEDGHHDGAQYPPVSRKRAADGALQQHRKLHRASTAPETPAEYEDPKFEVLERFKTGATMTKAEYEQIGAHYKEVWGCADPVPIEVLEEMTYLKAGFDSMPGWRGMHEICDAAAFGLWLVRQGIDVEAPLREAVNNIPGFNMWTDPLPTRLVSDWSKEKTSGSFSKNTTTTRAKCRGWWRLQRQCLPRRICLCNGAFRN
jgi:hypothetical protein